MKTQDNTYSLLVRSEEKERNVAETAVYVLMLVSTVFSIWQFAQQPLAMPSESAPQASPLAQVAAPEPQGV